MQLRLLTVTVFSVFLSLLNANAQTVTKQSAVGSVSIDGCGTYCDVLDPVIFSASDFSSGCRVTDVDVTIRWAKTDGTCSSPDVGDSFHRETNFRIDGPNGNTEVLVPTDYYGGSATMSAVTTRFNQGSGLPTIAGGTPQDGTFGPAGGGNLNDFVGISAFGPWELKPGDDAGADPLCVDWYSVTITTSADNTAPTWVSFPSNQTFNTLPGLCTATVSWTTPTASDQCTATVTQISGPTSGSSLAPGTYNVVYRASDPYGNAVNRTLVITVVDNQPLSIVCPSNISVNAPSGQCAAVVTYSPATASDNCSFTGPSLLSGPGSGSSFPVGTTTVTYRAVQNSVNYDCSFNVTVNDTQNPTISCPTGTLTANAPSNACAANVSFSVTANDNCSPVNITSPSGHATNGGSFPVGNTAVSFVATDPSGRTAACSFNVMVSDITDPTITCPASMTVSANSNCVGTVTWTVPTGADACGILSVTQQSGPNQGPNFPLGASTVVLRATDVNGNTRDCNFTVTVVDNTDPVVTCPTPTINYTAGACGAQVTWANPTVSDNCTLPIGALQRTDVVPLTSGNTFQNGSYTISYQLTDGAGNTDNCSFSFTIADTEDPEWDPCPASFTVSTDPDVCTAVVNFNIDAEDNCTANPTITQVSALGNGDVFPLGATIVEYSVVDAAGNSPANCVFTVTVEDTEFPEVVCPASLTTTFPNCQYQLNDFTGASGILDNCGLASVVQTPSAGIITAQTTVTITATDNAGNASTCSWTVTPFDNTPPTFDNCPAVTQLVPVNNSCQFLMPDFTGLQVSDVCNPTLTLTQSPAAGTLHLSALPVSVTVSDGTNETDCIFQVAPQDLIAPTITCPADRTVPANASCQGVLGDYTSLPSVTTSDNCSGAVTVSQPSIGNVITGSATVTLNATDAAGNVGSCTFTVTVSDNVPPTVTCPIAQTVFYNANCTYTMADFRSQASSADNCGGSVSLVQVPAAGTSVGGPTTSVTITGTDGSGNSASCQFNLTIQDNIAPSIACPQAQQVNVNGDCEYSLGNFTSLANSTDGCSAVMVAQSPAAGTVYDFTSNSSVTVTLTATDGSGNDNSCNFQVLLNDVTDPVIVCAPDINVLFNGNCQFTVGNRTSHYVGLLSDMDNCDAAPIITQSPSASTVIQGQTTITLTATDASGNQGTCQFDIIPSDSQAPSVVSCPQAPVSVNYDGNCNYTLGDYSGLASFLDNCDQSLTVTQNPAFGTVVTSQSQTSVVLTAQDDAGNTATCAVTVNPVDATAPSLTCPSNQLEDFDANCQFTLVDYTSLAVASDNCSNPVQVTQFPTTGSISGTTQIVLTAVDGAGNSTSCSFFVIPDDNTDPTITCPADQVVAVNAQCAYNMTDMTGLATGVSDNCPSSVTVTQSVGVGVALASVTPITLTATDGAGNTATCQFNVVPQDQTAPTIACPQNQVVNASGACTYDLADYTSQAVANDFCDASVSVTQQPTPVTGISVGTTTTVTLTATDDALNSSTCSFTVSAVDNSAPSISCPTDTVVTTNSGCQFVMIDETDNHEIVLTDNCDPSPVVSQSPAVSAILTGTTTVTLTATDASGNSSTCTYQFIVEDQVDPTITCPADQLIGSNSSCDYVIPDFTNAAITADNCNGGSLTVTQDPLPIVNTITVDTVVTLTVTDAGGNTSNCTFLITADVSNLPQITCPGDLIVDLDANCTYQLEDYRNLATATDNCGTPTVAQTQAVGLTITGPTSIELVATDDDLNTVSCTFDVIPQDISAPSVSCMTPTVTVASGAQCSFILPDYTGQQFVGATDNCATSFTFSQSPVAGSLIGGATVVTLSTDDGAGNIGSCTITVTPEDQTDPVLFCPGDITVDLDGDCEFAVPDYTSLVFVTDNCDAAPFTIQQTPTAATLISGEAQTTISFSVTDAGGNVGTCSFVLTTEDNQAPTITCPPSVEVDVDGDCEFQLLDYVSQVVADDNCATPTVVQLPAAGGTYNTAVTVSMTATDDAGNSNNCTFSVVPVDNTDPVLTCPADQTPNFTANCEFTLIDYRGLASYSDNCDNQLFITQSPGIGTIIGGSTTVTIVATDDAGNSTSCTFDIDPVDNQVPSISCPADLEVSLDASCSYSITDFTPLVTVTDNCATSPTLVQSPSSGTVSGAGSSSTITITALDGNGNSATCSFDLLLVDDTAPTLSNCPTNQTVPLSPSCTFIVPNYTGIPTANDNCDSNTPITQSPLAGSLIGGATVVTLFATDDDGNAGICSFTVTPEDTQAPTVFDCPSDIVVDNNTGICGAAVTYATITALDNCAGVVVPQLTQGQLSGTVFPVGTTPVFYVANDGNGNTTNCEFDVTVNDTEDPIIVCPNNITVDATTGTCGADVTYSLPTVTDNCTAGIVPTLEAGVVSGSNFVVGATTVTYQAEDQYGNTSSCSFQISVEDAESPVITCPLNITVSSDPGSCDAVVNYNLPTVTDNCTNPITPVLTLGLSSGSTFPLGTTPIRYSATDAAGNTSLCSFSVTVEDNEDPVLTCPADFSVNVDPATCQAVVSYDQPTVTDNCNSAIVPTLQAGPASGDLFDLGDTQVTFLADDGNGQTVTCNFIVTVIDNEEPTIACSGDQLETFNAQCQLSLPDYTGLALTTDNCDTDPAVTQSPAIGTVVTGPTVVVLTSTDFTGNSASCSFTVVDDSPPSIACPSNQTVGSNISCQFTIPDYMIQTVSSDNCGSVVLSQSPAVGVLISGLTTVTVTSEDVFGNQADCSFTVDLIDNIDPSITCIGNQQVFFNANCEYQLPDYTVQASSVDNCDLSPTITQSPAPGSTIFGASAVTFTSTDDEGNSSSCTFTVFPVDNIPPTVSCPGTQIAQFDANCEFALSDYTSLVSTGDNCGGTVTLTQSPASGTVLSTTTIVSVVAEDDAGNTSSCSFLVNPEDDIEPSIVCPSDLEVDVNANCVYTLVDYTSEASVTDNCSSNFILTQSPPAGGDIAVTTTITLSAQDQSGNSSSCEFDIIPVDNIAPVLVCSPDLEVVFNANCGFEIGDYAGAVVASDNCGGIVLITQSPAAGTVVLGQTLVTVTGTDESGNEGTCTFSVNPSDDEEPVVTCPSDQNVTFGSTCGYTLPDYTALASASDNCSNNILLTQSIAAGSVIGDTVTIIITANDGNGNTATCSFDVNPSDVTPPTVTCPGTQQVAFDANCQFELPDYKIDVVAADNCQATTISQSPAEGTLISGTTPVTITVTDGAGNQVSCTFSVIPSDGLAPVITCPSDMEVVLDEDCQFELDDYTSMATVSDNCGSIASVGQFPPAGVFILSATELTLTAEDNAGNQTSCSFVVSPFDATAPVIAACPPDQQASLNANCVYTIPSFASLISGTDNCDASLTYGQIPAQGSQLQATGSYNITVGFVDDAGNTASCEFDLLLEDGTAPTVACPQNQVLQLDANCEFTLPDYTALATGSDACGDVVLTQSPAAGSAITTALNATVIATDESGNTATCTFFVEVVEMAVSVSGTGVTCANGNNGSATVTVTGGTAPYTQNWGGFNPNALAPGNYSVTVSDVNGCSVVGNVTIENAEPFQIEVDPSGDVFVCPGDAVVLSVGTGYAQYNWSTGATVPSITVSTPATYWVSVVNADGCLSNTDTVTLAYYNIQTPTISEGADGVLYCSNDTASSYQWYFNGAPISGANDNWYCPTASGIYRVVLVDNNGCEVSSATSEFTFSDDSPCATGIEEYGLTMEIFPNPSSGLFTVNYSIDHQSSIELSVIDLMGQQVTGTVLLQGMQGRESIDLSTDAQGVYTLRIVIDGNKVIQKRLIVVR